MEIFTFALEKDEAALCKKDYWLNADTIHREYNGIIYLFSGVASASVIFDKVKEFLSKKSKELELNLSTQICIHVNLNNEGQYKGYSILYVANPSAYCLLIGLTEAGQKILLDDVDRRATQNALILFEKYMLANPELISLLDIDANFKIINNKCKDVTDLKYTKYFEAFKSPASKSRELKELNKLTHCRRSKKYLTIEEVKQYITKHTCVEINHFLQQAWYAESYDRLKTLVVLASLKGYEHVQSVVDVFEDLYQKELDKIEDSWKTPKYYEASYTYEFTKKDIDNLGHAERNKKGIVDNIGKITMIVPMESPKDWSNTTLITYKGTNDFDNTFFINLFRPFRIVKLTMGEQETQIEFENKRMCYLANLLYKTVKIDENVAITFQPPNLTTKKFVSFKH